MSAWGASPGVNRPVHEADYTPPSSEKIKNGGAIIPLPHTPLWRSNVTLSCLDGASMISPAEVLLDYSRTALPEKLPNKHGA
jgi:hypothetical protein